jgi:hypothetical protein
MPKGEIVGMFTGRVCLSLMARTMMENRKEKKNNNNDGKQEQRRRDPQEKVRRPKPLNT